VGRRGTKGTKGGGEKRRRYGKATAFVSRKPRKMAAKNIGAKEEVILLEKRTRFANMKSAKVTRHPQKSPARGNNRRGKGQPPKKLLGK